jgi:hypothetical protein
MSIPEYILVLVLQTAFLLFLTWTLYKTWRALQPRNEHSLRSVAILVLGDIGRSPRMMYHAQSFAENGFMTDLIGYGGMHIDQYLAFPTLNTYLLQAPNQFHPLNAFHEYE